MKLQGKNSSSADTKNKIVLKCSIYFYKDDFLEQVYIHHKIEK